MDDDLIFDAIDLLRSEGFALHWLHPRTKRPIGESWSEAPVATLDELQATYRPGNNLGVRLGEFSHLNVGGYLHVLDIDIRLGDLRDEAWDRLTTLFPGVRIDELPCVASSGGTESRHLYVVLDQAFRSKKLATSEGKHRDPTNGRWRYDWEIELFGTGKQVAMPPSVHPESGKRYTWLRSFDFIALALGATPNIPSSLMADLLVAEHTTYEYESRDPLTFTEGQLRRTLDDIPISDLHYDDWIGLGQALHHQYGGATEGFDLWLEYTRRSKKFTGENQVREMRRSKWRSFGKYRGRSITMATVVQWASEARIDRLRNAFDEEPDQGEPVARETLDFDALLGITAANDDESPVKTDPIDTLDSANPTTALLSPSTDWMSLLHLNEDGDIKATLHNIEMIVRNDDRITGLPQLNDFTHETVQRIAPGLKANRRKNAAKQTRQLSGKIWQVEDELNGELWSDDRDFALRSILEAPLTQGGYAIKISDRDLKAAVVIAANEHVFHPVREYLEGTTWDMIPRVERLFIDYLGAPDDAYVRSVGRLMLTAAVTRIFEPGHKYDFAVILEGLQGKRKSTFIEILGRRWFAELNGDFHDSKQMIELMQGAWIMEIPELSGFGRADVRQLKAFISGKKDRARLAYARRAGEFPRQCIFIGSTNDREYLKDDTGGRRFWPMLCNAPEIDTERLEREVDQLWAEAVTLYRAMRLRQPYKTLPLYLTDPEARKIAERLQESRRVESVDDAMAGQIGAWLDRPITADGMDDTDPGQPRDETCLLQIWMEGLGNDRKSYNQQAAQSLGRSMLLVEGWEQIGKHRFPSPYGQQRRYARIGVERA